MSVDNDLKKAQKAINVIELGRDTIAEAFQSIIDKYAEAQKEIATLKEKLEAQQLE